MQSFTTTDIDHKDKYGVFWTGVAHYLRVGEKQNCSHIQETKARVPSPLGRGSMENTLFMINSLKHLTQV